MTDVQKLKPRIEEKIAELREQYGVPGYLGLVHYGGETVEVAQGIANGNTGQEMTPDTAFLLGSISKVLVTTLIMRFVERGLIDLDERVMTYLPDLRLGDEQLDTELRIRNLLNHTNGINASDFMPEAGRGSDATKRYVEGLAGKGAIHPLDQYVSYSNPGFVLAGRVLEVVTGDDFDTVLKRELFGPLGFQRTSTSGDEAILTRTAIGHVPDGEGGVRPTRRFMLSYSGAAAGATIITSLGDLLRLAQTHLAGGMVPGGGRLLSEDSVRAMQTRTTPPMPMSVGPFGLGWMVSTYGDVQVLMHAGGSFGGVSNLIVVPGHNFVVAAFGNTNAAGQAHGRLVQFLFDELLQLPAPSAPSPPDGIDPSRYVGVYQHFGMRVEVREGEQGLEMRAEPVYTDRHHEVMMTEYTGGTKPRWLRLRPAAENILVPAGIEPAEISTWWGRPGGIAFMTPDGKGRYTYLHAGMRISRRAA